MGAVRRVDVDQDRADLRRGVLRDRPARRCWAPRCRPGRPSRCRPRSGRGRPARRRGRTRARSTGGRWRTPPAPRGRGSRPPCGPGWPRWSPRAVRARSHPGRRTPCVGTYRRGAARARVRPCATDGRRPRRDRRRRRAPAGQPIPGWRSSAGRPGWTTRVPLVEPRSVTTAAPPSAPTPGRISRWVEEISWFGLGTLTSSTCSSSRPRGCGARPTTTTRSTSTTSPLENTRRATAAGRRRPAPGAR